MGRSFGSHRRKAEMAIVRFKNRFGRRYISLTELRDYAVDLDLGTDPPTEEFMDFLEVHGLLTPVRRIVLPLEIVRRLRKEEETAEPIIDPIEPDGPRLDAAVDLMNALYRWSNPGVYGEFPHPLDAMLPEHLPFVQATFPSVSFIPLNDRRVHLYDNEDSPVYANVDQSAPAFYHYWQIFWLAAILRSGIHVYYPLDDEALWRELLLGPLPAEALENRSHQTVNFEAYHELCQLREHERHFEAVGFYKAYYDNARLIDAWRDNPRRGDRRRFVARRREIARDVLSKSGLSQKDFLTFIGKQCEWWNRARLGGPAAVAEEYKRNINASIGFLRAATGIDPRRVIEAVGHRTGHFKPTLEVVFPDWTEEQRDLTIRSLKGWADEALATLPAPFPCGEPELNEFCAWLERRGLYQYYWHFRRLVELQRRDDPVHRAASTSEVVGFATLCEMITNEVMIERGLTPRGNTLSQKLPLIFDPHGPVDLGLLLKRFRKLANTSKQSLPRRLSQIARIKVGGAYNPVLRALLSFMVIRNEGAHLGLLTFDHAKVIEMIRILSLASLMIWKAR